MVVKSSEELEAAKKRGDKEIIIEGELANKLKRSKNLSMVGAGTLAVVTAVLGVATVSAPFTGGVSYLAAAPVAALTGLEIAAIIAATSVGLALVLAVYKDYEEVSFSDGRLVLRKKGSKP